MKLVILLALWLPTSFALLFFSLMTLVTYQSRNLKHDLSLIPNVQAQNLDLVFPTYTSSEIKISPHQDIRIFVLKKFLKDYRSPLFDYSEELVKQADIFGLDYALLPAIAMQESGGCKVIPENSFNCWGFGIYGDKITRFESYPQAITQVAKTIKESYIKKGASNPTLLEDRWTPSSRGQWSYAVNYFIGKIRNYEENIPAS